MCAPGPLSRNGTWSGAASAESPFPMVAARRSTWCWSPSVIEPNLDLPRALDLSIEGMGVSVDAGLLAADGVYCAGDIALHPHPVLEEAIRV